jgi:hypothetical protein
VLRSVLSECLDESSALRAAMISAAAGDADAGREKKRSRNSKKVANLSPTAERAAAVLNKGAARSYRPRANCPRVSARSDKLSGDYRPPPSTLSSKPTLKKVASKARVVRGGCTALSGLPPRVLNPGYINSYTGTCAVVGCRYGKPGDQIHSATTAATPCRAPGCTNMTHRLCGLSFAPNGADEPTACCSYCTTRALPL